MSTIAPIVRRPAPLLAKNREMPDRRQPAHRKNRPPATSDPINPLTRKPVGLQWPGTRRAGLGPLASRRRDALDRGEIVCEKRTRSGRSRKIGLANLVWFLLHVSMVHATDPDQVPTILHVDPGSIQILELPAEPPATLQLQLSIDEEARVINLTRHSVRDARFRVRAQGEDGRLTEVPAPPVSTYRGMVIGEMGSAVTASVHRRCRRSGRGDHRLGGVQ